MSGSDVAAIVVTIVAAVLVGALIMGLFALYRGLEILRETVDTLQRETIPLVEELRLNARRTRKEIDKVDDLLTAAESVTETVDSASRLVQKTVASPVVKAMALGSGTRRAVRRLRTGSTDR